MNKEKCPTLARCGRQQVIPSDYKKLYCGLQQLKKHLKILCKILQSNEQEEKGKGGRGRDFNFLFVL